MSVTPGWTHRVLVLAAWVGAMVAISLAGDVQGGWRFAGVVAVSLAAGYLSGTWWALAAPPLLAAVACALYLSDRDGDTVWYIVALAYLIAGAFVSLVMAGGVATRRAVAKRGSGGGAPAASRPADHLRQPNA